MCRSTSNGGRRCPAHSDPAKIAIRNRRRREIYREKQGAQPNVVYSATDFETLLSDFDTSTSSEVVSKDDSKQILSHLNTTQIRNQLSRFIDTEDIFGLKEDEELHLNCGSSSISFSIEGDDDHYQLGYVNLNNGFMFFGDDPENGMRNDMTFPITFGNIDRSDSIADVWAEMKALVARHHEKDNWHEDDQSLQFAYRQFGHFSINGALRRGENVSSDTTAFIERLCKDELEEDVVVYRGIQTTEEKKEQILDEIARTGTTSDLGLLSTSLDPRVAKNFAGGDKNGMVLAIQLKKGQRCWNVSDADNEQEIVLPPKTQAQVLGAYRMEDTSTVK